MNDDKTQPAVSTTPTAGSVPAAGASSSPWDLPADNIAPNGLPQGKTNTPATPSPDFSYSVKDDSFGDNSIVAEEPTDRDKEENLADKMRKSLETEERKPYLGIGEGETHGSASSSSADLSDLEKKIKDQKKSIDDEIEELERKKQKLGDILDKISALRKEEGDLASQAQDILK